MEIRTILRYGEIDEIEGEAVVIVTTNIKVAQRANWYFLISDEPGLDLAENSNAALCTLYDAKIRQRCSTLGSTFKC